LTSFGQKKNTKKESIHIKLKCEALAREVEKGRPYDRNRKSLLVYQKAETPMSASRARDGKGQRRRKGKLRDWGRGEKFGRRRWNLMTKATKAMPHQVEINSLRQGKGIRRIWWLQKEIQSRKKKKNKFK